jgi:hypothetical protein
MNSYNKTSIMVRGYFNGIYDWGEGWKSGVKEKWDEYLSTKKSYTWKHYRVNDICQTDYLHDITNIIFLHPLNFFAVLNECGCMTNGSYFKVEIEDLYEYCKGLAEYCGGTFTMEVSNEITSTYNMAEYSA